MIGLVIAHWFLEVLEKKNAYNEKKTLQENIY